MSEYKLIMPKMGESIAEATIISWLKNEGDSRHPISQNHHACSVLEMSGTLF